MRAAGVHAFLVGEAFMRAADPGAALADLVRLSPPDNRLRAPLAAAFDGCAPAAGGPSSTPGAPARPGARSRPSSMPRLAAGAVVYPADPLRALRADAARAHVAWSSSARTRTTAPGQAEGLAFSVPAGAASPPSLRNIFKELQRDLGTRRRLRRATSARGREHGVLLLNTDA